MIKIIFYLLCLNLTQCQLRKLEGFILEGEVAKIKDYPHSAYLESFCEKKRKSVCGSSILNQLILLTAAHCFAEECAEPLKARARFGNANQARGTKIRVSRFIMHEHYDDSFVHYDIALVLLESPVTFGSNIARVALRKSPVSNGEMGAVAGWGYVLLDPKTKTDVLRHVNQTIISREQCEHIIGEGLQIDEGLFCAENLQSRSYPIGGDSGSAFVVNRYIQVGLVSFQIPNYPYITMYTDVTYYYNWIKRNAYKLFCHYDLKNKDKTNKSIVSRNKRGRALKLQS